MFTIRFYIYGLIAGIISVLLGSVHPWVMSFLYVNVMWVALSQFAYWMIVQRNDKSTPKMKRLLTESFLATIIAIVAAALSVDETDGGFFSHILVVASVVEFGISKLLTIELTPLLPKRERRRK